MRLVYLLLSPTFGMHQYTADLANRLSEVSDVHLVTMIDFPADRYAPRVKVHTPVKVSTTGLSVEGLNLRHINLLKKTIAALKADVVHITGPHLWNIYLVRWLRSINVPVIHTIHDLDPHPGTKMGRLLHLWNWLIIREVDHVLVHGRCYKRRIQDQGVSGDKISFTPLLHLFLSYRHSKDVDKSSLEVSYERFMLYFGRLEPYKGLETLLRAYEIIFADNLFSGANLIRLIIAGQGRLPRTWQGPLPTGVEWKDRLVRDDEAMDLFRGCSLVVLPYSEATQSALIGSAYYFYKPVIATRTGALSEYVIDGRTGYLIDPDDPPGLARALKAIFSDPQNLRTMGNAGRKWYDDQRGLETQTLFDLYSSFKNNKSIKTNYLGDR